MKKLIELFLFLILFGVFISGCGISTKQQYPFVTTYGSLDSQDQAFTTRPVEMAVDDIGIVRADSFEIRYKGLLTFMGHIEGDMPVSGPNWLLMSIAERFSKAGQKFDEEFITPFKKNLHPEDPKDVPPPSEAFLTVGKIYIFPIWAAGSYLYCFVSVDTGFSPELKSLQDPLVKIAIYRAIQSKKDAKGIFITNLQKDTVETLFTEKVSVQVEGHALSFEDMGVISQERWDFRQQAKL